jgi:hypothetical protein
MGHNDGGKLGWGTLGVGGKPLGGQRYDDNPVVSAHAPAFLQGFFDGGNMSRFGQLLNRRG